MATMQHELPTAKLVTSRTRFGTFLAYFALLPILAYLGVFVIVMTPALGYEHWGPSKWGPVLQFPFSVRSERPDVVVFGDSSAFLGIDPRIVDARLGIQTVVIPNTIGSLPVSGELGLRNYLEHNQPPSLIVLYFTAWDLDYQHTAKSRLFEGEEMLLHNGSWSQIASFARHHPLEILAFPLRLNSTLGLHNLVHLLRGGNRGQATLQARGHADYTEPFPPLASDCSIPPGDLAEHDDATAQDLIRRYTTPQTRVVVYIAPVPNCRNASLAVDRPFPDVGAAAPAALPASSFAYDGFYAHIEPAAVPEATEVFIRALRQLIPQPVIAASRAPQ